MLFTLAFWKAAAERAVWTFAQVLGSIIGLDGTGAIPVHIDWSTSLYVAGVAALLSVLKSITSLFPVVTPSAPVAEPAPAEAPAPVAPASAAPFPAAPTE